MKCYDVRYSRERTANPTDAVPVNFVSMNYCFMGQSTYILLKCISCCGKTKMWCTRVLTSEWLRCFMWTLMTMTIFVMHLCQCRC